MNGLSDTDLRTFGAIADTFFAAVPGPNPFWTRSASELGLSSMRMPSGAGHDAQSIALLCPVGMIFVPSVDGISHAPEEHTHLEDIVNGSNVLLRTLLALDRSGTAP